MSKCKLCGRPNSTNYEYCNYAHSKLDAARRAGKEIMCQYPGCTKYVNYKDDSMDNVCITHITKTYTYEDIKHLIDKIVELNSLCHKLDKYLALKD